MNPDLEEILQSGEFEDNGGIQIRSLRWIDEDLSILISVDTGMEGSPKQAWEIGAQKVRKERIERAWIDNLGEYDDHIVLLPYNDQVGQLYFSRLEYERDNLLGSLYRRLRDFSNDWLQLSEFLNYRGLLLKGDSGCLAEGPVTILKLFQEEIELRGGVGDIVGIRNSKRWDGQGWVDEHKNLKALVFGGSFVIAARFNFQRHNQSA